MKTLVLARHAQSDKKDPALSDFDRPLNRRGESGAFDLAEQFAVSDLRVDALISSPAVRARSTAGILAKKISVPVQTDERIYTDGVQKLLEMVRSFDDRHSTIVLIGHNPGLSEFLRYLTDDNYADLPTASAAVVNLPINVWRHTSSGKGTFKGVLSSNENILELRRGPALHWKERYRIWQFEHAKQIYLSVIFAFALVLILGVVGLLMYKSTDFSAMPQQGSGSR
ncbi:MAG: histidine phosphatase family protein [Kiritimatiellales bacterium]